MPSTPSSNKQECYDILSENLDRKEALKYLSLYVHVFISMYGPRGEMGVQGIPLDRLSGSGAHMANNRKHVLGTLNLESTYTT